MRVILPEAADVRILQSAERLVAEQICDVSLLGDAATIEVAAKEAGVSLEGVSIVNPESHRLDDYAQAYLEGRGKGSLALARRAVSKPLYYAAMMVRSGDADVMVAGIAHPTKRVIEAAQLCIGLEAGVSTPSSFFLMKRADRPDLMFADCAVVVEPTVDELADIAYASALSAAKLLDEQPRVAMLSFSTHGSAQHAHAQKVVEATATLRAKNPELLVEGELQADSALAPAIAALKVKADSAVAGRANVLVFPDLDAGNIAYKLVRELAGYEALGPVLQGFAKPVADLSRGASVDDVVAITAVTISLAKRS